MWDLAERGPRAFRKRWADNEIAAIWQALSFKVEYRCFNCVATCPAEIERTFHDDRQVRRQYLDETLKPLTHTRGVEDTQFVIDTPGARDTHDIPPGEWRTPIDRAGNNARGVRLVSLRRIRTQNVDAMMRWMPQYFRPSEARGLAFTTAFVLDGPGGGEWTMRIADERCEVRPGPSAAAYGAADLLVRMPALLLLAIHRGDASPVWGLLTGRIRLRGRRRLFLLFPRLFPTEAPSNAPARARPPRATAAPLAAPSRPALARRPERTGPWVGADMPPLARNACNDALLALLCR